MLAKLRQHLTYANIVATLALCLALGGGTAYALAGHNTVFSDDIAPNQVKGTDTSEASLKIPRIYVEDVSSSSTAAGEYLSAFADCPAGYSLTGGGFVASTTGAELQRATVIYNFPYTDQYDRTRWSVEAISTASGQTVSAQAICMKGTTLPQ